MTTGSSDVRLRFDARHCVVIGGSEGIGFATARILASGGGDVTIVGRRSDALDRATANLREATGRQVSSIPCDVLDGGAVQAVLSTVAGDRGSIDVVVVATGASTRSTVSTSSDSDWSESYELNVVAVMRVLRLAKPYLTRSNCARFVCVGAASGRQPTPGQAASNAAKAALVAAVRDAGRELAAAGITVNCVLPGRIASPRRDRRYASEAAERGVPVEHLEAETVEDIPMGRLGTADEVAAVLTFLASEHASYVTGTSVLADGGLVRGIP